MIFDTQLISSGFDMEQIIATQTVNAAIVNVSGRQRMLSQRAAMFCLRLVHSQDEIERKMLRQELQQIVTLLEQSHQGLLYGDLSLNLPGHPSAIVQAMYFEPPLEVDKHIRNYINQIRTLLKITDAELKLVSQHPLQSILQAASTTLLLALDAVVSQYQKESEAEQRLLAARQAELYQQRCAAAAAAEAQAQQLKQALIELHQTQAQLIQAEKMSSLGQLVAGIAHEINNPINFISGNLNYIDIYFENLLRLLHLYQKHYPSPTAEIATATETMDFDFLQEDVIKILNSMKVGSDRIRQIVLSLRNFSRLDEAECKAVNIHDGINSALLILQHRLKAKPECPEIEVIRNFDNIPLVECYPGQLNQVMMNILTNAIDALGEKSALTKQKQQKYSSRIVISTSIVNSQWVQISIADNGSGMSQETQQRIFDPFFTTKPVGKGTGMGMSISYQIITEKHGGKLMCFSTLGKGSEFIIQIPIWQSAEA